MADAIAAGGLTPSRSTIVTFDFGEPVLTEACFGLRRAGGQIKPKTLTRCIRLQSGVWILEPLNNNRSFTHEALAGSDAVIRLADFAGVTNFLAEHKKFRQLGELSGLSYDAAVQGAGDWYINKVVPASGSWDQDYSGSITKPTLPTLYVGMDRLVESTATHDPMTGYLINFITPGPFQRYSDNFATFYFGGPVDAAGHGQFAVMLAGDGQAILYEFLSNDWAEVNRWQYLPKDKIPYGAFTMRIIPHAPRYIEFSFGNSLGFHNLIGEVVSAGIRSIQAQRHEGATTFTHEITNRPIGFNSTTGNLITGSGRIGLDVRRDLRAEFQIQRLIYPASGVILDSAFQLPGGYGNDHAVPVDGHDDGTSRLLRLNLSQWNYTTGATFVTSVDTDILKTSDQSSLATGTESYTYNEASKTYSGFKLPKGQNLLQAKFTLRTSESNPRYHTPAFLGYEAVRSCQVETISLTSPVVSPSPVQVSITGPGVNPEDESASLIIKDAKDELLILRTRGKMAARIETTYDGTGDKTIAFEGYVAKPTARLRGKAGRVYPSPNWRDLDVPLLGKWDRLRDNFFQNLKSFVDDSTSPSGSQAPAGTLLPWKVTDVIHQCLLDGGWLESQIDVFDDPLPMFILLSAVDPNYYTPAPGTNYYDYAQRLARDFFNAFLLWDANAGDHGMWRLQQPPNNTTTAVWSFVTPPNSAGTLAHVSASYGAQTSPILDVGPLSTYIVPPEANLITVYGGYKGSGKDSGERFQSFIPNRISWNAPGFSLADPSSLDYIGRCVPLVYVDLMLKSQQACDFVARRLFELACRGRKFAQFTAEFVLIDATADPKYTTRKRRPLRIGDLVLLDSTPYVIHSCNPSWRKDHLQMAHYEAELFRPGTTFG